MISKLSTAFYKHINSDERSTFNPFYAEFGVIYFVNIWPFTERPLDFKDVLIYISQIIKTDEQFSAMVLNDFDAINCLLSA